MFDGLWCLFKRSVRKAHERISKSYRLREKIKGIPPNEIFPRHKLFVSSCFNPRATNGNREKDRNQKKNWPSREINANGCGRRTRTQTRDKAALKLAAFSECRAGMAKMRLDISSLQIQSPFIFFYAFGDRFNSLNFTEIYFAFRFAFGVPFAFSSPFRFCAATMSNDNFLLLRLSCHRRGFFAAAVSVLTKVWKDSSWRRDFTKDAEMRSRCENQTTNDFAFLPFVILKIFSEYLIFSLLDAKFCWAIFSSYDLRSFHSSRIQIKMFFIRLIQNDGNHLRSTRERINKLNY